jgi:hypothetical protein
MKKKKGRRPLPRNHSITYRDTDGRMIEAYVLGNAVRSSALFRRKDMYVRCLREGLRYPDMVPDDTVAGNPELAQQVSDMTLLAFLKYTGLLAGWREVKSGHYYVNRWALDEEE